MVGSRNTTIKIKSKEYKLNSSTIQKRKNKKPSNEYYIDKEKFFIELSKYIEEYNLSIANNGRLPIPSSYIGECIILIANKLSLSRSFSGYSFIDEMRDYAIENCIQYLHKFKPYPNKISKITGEKIEKGDPFAYFTRVCHFAFVRKIQDEEKANYIKHKMLDIASKRNEVENISDDDKFYFNSSFSEMGIDRSAEIIQKFESRMKKNKDKQLEKRKLKELEYE